MVPMQKSIRFFIRILPAFFARVNPVSTMANPACIQNTHAAPMRNHTPKTRLLVLFKTLSKVNSIVASSIHHLICALREKQKARRLRGDTA